MITTVFARGPEEVSDGAEWECDSLSYPGVVLKRFWDERVQEKGELLCCRRHLRSLSVAQEYSSSDWRRVTDMAHAKILQRGSEVAVWRKSASESG